MNLLVGGPLLARTLYIFGLYVLSPTLHFARDQHQRFELFGNAGMLKITLYL